MRHTASDQWIYLSIKIEYTHIWFDIKKHTLNVTINKHSTFELNQFLNIKHKIKKTKFQYYLRPDQKTVDQKKDGPTTYVRTKQDNRFR